MSPRNLMIVGLALLPAAGCDWRKFDDLADTAWVKSSGSPGGLNAGEWGVGLAYGNGSGDGVTFVAAGQRPDGVGTIVYDARGEHSGNGILAAETGVTNLDALPLRPPMAGDPDQGAVALGMSTGGDSGGQVIVFDTAGPALLTSYAVGATGIDALATGAVNEDVAREGTVDLVVVNQNQLTVIGNYIATVATDRSQNTCQLGAERGYSVAIGELGSFPESEIAVGMGSANQDGAAGSVMLLPAATVVTANGVNCADTGVPQVLPAPGGEPSFGDQIVIADLDGSGASDLAVSAPGANRVYVWLDLDLTAIIADVPPSATIDGPSGSGRFGEALAAGDFDGTAGAELLVGDGAATVDGNANAGRAWIIEGDFTTLHELGDARPEAEQRFGRAVAVGKFGGTVDVIAVAAHNEVFTYFRTPLNDSDVRD